MFRNIDVGFIIIFDVRVGLADDGGGVVTSSLVSFTSAVPIFSPRVSGTSFRDESFAGGLSRGG